MNFISYHGDRYITTCKESCEYYNAHSPHLLQYGKINRRQFTPKGVCKNCGETTERGKCDSPKISEFLTDKEGDIATVKHYGTHSCSPLKTKPEKRLSKEINSTNTKACVMKRDLLSTLIKEGADFHQIEAKAAQFLNRPLLNKIKN